MEIGTDEMARTKGEKDERLGRISNLPWNSTESHCLLLRKVRRILYPLATGQSDFVSVPADRQISTYGG